MATKLLRAPSPHALEGIASGGIKSDDDHTPELNVHVHPDVLETFDPLAHHEEQRARDAWENAEGHPPPPAPPAPPPVPPKQDDLPPPQEPGGATSSSFPSFSSFARSFALPSLPNMNISLVAGSRARPQSLDTAVIVPTPVHSAVFASQQHDDEIAARGSPKMDPAALPPLPVQNALRRDDPSQERTAVKDKDPQFDFQKFLDQMKSKSAEPVARYLRS